MNCVYVYIMDSIKKINGSLFHDGHAPWPLWWDTKAYYSGKDSERLKYQEPGVGNIFLGACKMQTRFEIRKHMRNFPEDIIHIVGLSNTSFNPRNIVYYLKVDGEPLTFEHAYYKYPELRGTGIHIKPTNKLTDISYIYRKKERHIKLRYEHLGVMYNCKKAAHSDKWVADIARDYSTYTTFGPDCCFMGSKDSAFFGKNNINIDEDFCELLKRGYPFKGTLVPDLINVCMPIPKPTNPRGNHLVLEGKSASLMIEKLVELKEKIL